MTCKLLTQSCGVEVISSKQTGGVGVVITGGGGGGGHTSEQMRPGFDPADVRVVSVRRHFTDLHRATRLMMWTWSAAKPEVPTDAGLHRRQICFNVFVRERANHSLLRY